MKNKRLVIFITLLLICFLVSGITLVASAQGELKLALVLPGSINDAGWNAAAYNALQSLKSSGNVSEVAFAEKVAQADIETNIRDFAAKGYDVIFGHGFQFGDPIVAVAPDFPDTYFFIINGAVFGDNYSSLTFANWQTDYIIGILAGKLTKTNKLGAVAAFEIPSLVRPLSAFKAGAKSVNDKVEVYATFIGSWSDINKANEAALALADQGCDIIHVNCDAAAHGAYEGCKNAGVYAIGNTADQNSLAPDTIITSSLRNVSILFELALDIVQSDKFTGAVYQFGLKDGATDFSSFHGLDNMVPQEVKDLMNKAKQDIIEGKIIVPTIDQWVK